jgi:hypothetical protein
MVTAIRKFFKVIIFPFLKVILPGSKDKWVKVDKQNNLDIR